MNETLKRRLVGLLLIILVLFVLSLVLPKPGESPLEDQAIQRVTLDMRASDVQPTVIAPVSVPLPSAIAAVNPMAPQVVDKVAIDLEPDTVEPVTSEAASAIAKRPTPKIAEKSQAPAPAHPPKMAATKSEKSSQPATKSTAPLGWFVQIGAFSDVNHAREQLSKYKEPKHPGVLAPMDTRKGPLYRVRIGPYAKKEQAAAAQQRMIKAGALGTALVEE